MSEDPYALKLYIDGSALDNPGGSGGIACFAEFPESWNRLDEEIFTVDSTRAPIIAWNFKPVSARLSMCGCGQRNGYRPCPDCYGFALRFQQPEDAVHVAKKWLEDKRWKTCRKLRPLEEVSHPSPRVQGAHGHHLEKGQEEPDSEGRGSRCKKCRQSPNETRSRAFGRVRLRRSKITGGASSLYPAKGQEGIVHIYRSALLRKTDHKVYFDVFDAGAQAYAEKCTAYVSVDIVGELHRGTHTGCGSILTRSIRR